jgi:hypothetical protein
MFLSAHTFAVTVMNDGEARTDCPNNFLPNQKAQKFVSSNSALEQADSTNPKAGDSCLEEELPMNNGKALPTKPPTNFCAEATSVQINHSMLLTLDCF